MQFLEFTDETFCHVCVMNWWCFRAKCLELRKKLTNWIASWTELQKWSSIVTLLHSGDVCLVDLKPSEQLE